MSNIAPAASIATPPAAKPGLAARLLADPRVQELGCRLALKASELRGGPIRLGKNVFALRYTDAIEVLRRDLEFRIAPINAAKIEAVSGPFILGMDRGVTLGTERAALYEALGKVDLAPINRAIAGEAERRITAAGDTIDAVGAYARPIAAQTAMTMFGIAPADRAAFMDDVRAVFGHVFLNLSNDKAVEERALEAGRRMRPLFDTEITRRHEAKQFGNDLMGALLDGGTLDDDGIRRTLSGMLVGSIDTTATCVAKIMTVIGGDAALGKAIAVDVAQPARLAGWCREALRRWPHNPLVMREAAIDTRLSGVEIKAKDKIWVITQAAMLDASVFPDPRRLDPERPTHVYMHFGGGLHPCAGRALNASQIPLLVGALVRRGIGSVGKIEWTGPFPDRLPITFNRTRQ